MNKYYITKQGDTFDLFCIPVPNSVKANIGEARFRELVHGTTERVQQILKEEYDRAEILSWKQ